MRTIPQVLKDEKAKLESSEILTLVELQISDVQTIYLHMGDEDIIFDSTTYEKWNIALGDITENIDGTIDTFDLSVGNVSREMQSYVEANNGLRGNKVTVKQVYRNLLSDPTAFVAEVYYVMSAQSKGEEVAFRCTSKFDQAGIRLPLNKASRLHCDWEYDGTECGWTTFSGALDTTNYPLADSSTCDKGLNTPNGCKAHLNSDRPRMFQGIPEGETFV
jgi:lambda family phage minor tail protein L